jgi:hypothetical protein
MEQAVNVNLHRERSLFSFSTVPEHFINKET